MGTGLTLYDASTVISLRNASVFKMLFASSLVAGVGIVMAAGTQTAPSSAGNYVGSAACARCHAPIAARARQTRMANVVRDPREHPEAIIADFATSNPLVTFTIDQIAFVYGGKYKQRYFRRSGNDFSPLPAQWDVTHHVWRPYDVSGATSQLCDGCHSVNFDVARNTVTEWNVGCERCHGPGSTHVTQPSRSNIVNPARLDPIAAVDVCIQCHSEGHPPGPIAGIEYHWPVGFTLGRRLSEFWQLEIPTLGQTAGLHYGDGTGRENRMQGNDFVQSVMYTRGVTCFDCHDPHGTPNNADLIKPASVLCLTCHGPRSPNGPHTPTIEAHTHHRPGSAGSECVGCHMPKIAQIISDVMVRSHTFKFITPSAAARLKMPDPCTTCHTDRTRAWATEALRSWPEFSPWRVGQ